MNNYEYIIASLPEITRDAKSTGSLNVDDVVEWIKSQCSSKDVSTIDTLLKGYDENALGEDFYRSALSHKNRFIKEFFAYDLEVRNAKVRYLNHAFGRPESQDIFMETGHTASEADAVLQTDDILAREHGLDDLMWKKIEEITTFDYFDIEKILGFIAKLHIVSRWMNLNEETGEQMFKNLLSEVRGTFKGVEYNEK